MIADNATSESLEQPSDLGTSPQAMARRWKLELKLADKREQEWRDRAKDVYRLYTPSSPEKNSYNILYPNTETLRQAVYNSLPQPQCKRRYADEDPLGLKVGEILTRALEFAQDCSDFNLVCQHLVVSMLVPGRAVAWERYVPDIRSAEGSTTDNENAYEEVEWEQVVSEKVQYDDFRILCAAKTWDEVTAIGRRHTLGRKDLIAKFGEEIGNAVKLDGVDIENEKDSQDADLFKTAEVWEIWDKESKMVIFISRTYPVPLKVEQDPLGLTGFFPTPRPLYAIENDNTLEPACLYTQYDQQAKELNRVSRRINMLVDALRLRGIYDATLSELSQLMKSGDNDLIPAQNVTALIDRGGLDKAIWMMPINIAAAVLKELHIQRDSTKQVIYEITGISDIMRSAADPRETFGAQKIKSQWGTQRLQRMQREVQRYIRDMIRIKAEIISKKFQMETLEKMTMVQMPHQQQIDQKKQMAMMQYQQAAMQAQMQGQPMPHPPQFPPDPPTWEAVMAELQDDCARTYHIDIETDSTLSATQDADMEGLKTTITGIVELMNGFGPAVQSGVVPMDVVKSLVGVVVRRAKMGTEVEDAIAKMQQPPPPGPTKEQQKAQAEQQKQQMAQQHEQQLEQSKMQMQMQIEQAQMQADVATEQARAQASITTERARMEADAQIDQLRAQMDAAVDREKAQGQFELDHLTRQHQMEIETLKAQLAQYKHETQLGADMEKAQLDSATKIAVAQISAQSALDQSVINASNAEIDRELD